MFSFASVLLKLIISGMQFQKFKFSGGKIVLPFKAEAISQARATTFLEKLNGCSILEFYLS